LTGSIFVAPGATSAQGIGPLAPGSVVVTQGGSVFGGTNTGTGVELNGELAVYSPDANGNAAPVASLTNGSFGPTTTTFDPSGDLWVANENTSDIFEFTKVQLSMADPVPAVTIYAEAGALANPFGMAFDASGNLWVVSNTWGKVYEYTKAELARSGGPSPAKTISHFPANATFGVAFDPSGDLWVSTARSVVEFSKAELAKADPAPTVTISKVGGPQLVFDPSGDLWLVTGGGPYCFGSPCTNEVVELTKAQLSASGSPTPAIIIRSTIAGAAGSIYGPYSLAFTSSGDLWVENFNNNSIVEYAKDQLRSSGSPVPVRKIAGPTTGMNFPSYVVVEP
jgi:streptogramin lyase